MRRVILFVLAFVLLTPQSEAQPLRESPEYAFSDPALGFSDASRSDAPESIDAWTVSTAMSRLESAAIAVWLDELPAGTETTWEIYAAAIEETPSPRTFIGTGQSVAVASGPHEAIVAWIDGMEIWIRFVDSSARITSVPQKVVEMDPSAWPQTHPDLAVVWTGGSYALVWTEAYLVDPRRNTLDFRVVASLISPDGRTLLGPRLIRDKTSCRELAWSGATGAILCSDRIILINANLATLGEVPLASDTQGWAITEGPTGYTVASSTPRSPSGGTPSRLKVTRMTSRGVELSTVFLDLQIEELSDVSIRWNGTNHLLLWDQHCYGCSQPGPSPSLLGVRLDSDGRPIDLEPIEVASGPRWAPSALPTDDGFLISWGGDDGQTRYAELADVVLSPGGSDGTNLSFSASAQHRPVIARCGAGSCVAWFERDTIKLRRFTSRGPSGDAATINYASDDPPAIFQFFDTRRGSRLVWIDTGSDANGPPDTILMADVDSDTGRPGPIRTLYEAGDDSRIIEGPPHVALGDGPSGLLLAWQEERGPYVESPRTLVRPLSADGIPEGDAFDIGIEAVPWLIASAGDHCLLVYGKQYEGGAYGVVLDLDGRPVTGTEILLAATVPRPNRDDSCGSPRLVSNGENYLLVWSRGRVIRYLLIAPDGLVLVGGAEGKIVTDGDMEKTLLNVLWTGAEYVVRWYEPGLDGEEIALHQVRLTGDGELLDLPPNLSSLTIPGPIEGDEVLLNGDGSWTAVRLRFLTEEPYGAVWRGFVQTASRARIRTVRR